MTAHGDIFVTSDPHFGHENILTHCPARGEKWPTIEAHDQGLIKAWNAVVHPTKDVVFILGDVFLCDHHRAQEIAAQLNGRQIFIVLGNHDRTRAWLERVDERITAMRGPIRLPLPFLRSVVLNHEPGVLPNWMRDETLGLHGHTHQNAPRLRNWLSPGGRVIQMNVGVDQAPHYAPYSLRQVAKIIGRERKALAKKARALYHGY